MNKTEELKLLPCPFCNGEARFDYNMFGDYIVICTECPAEMRVMHNRSKEYVQGLWNRRHRDDEYN